MRDKADTAAVNDVLVTKANRSEVRPLVAQVVQEEVGMLQRALQDCQARCDAQDVRLEVALVRAL